MRLSSKLIVLIVLGLFISDAILATGGSEDEKEESSENVVKEENPTENGETEEIEEPVVEEEVLPELTLDNLKTALEEAGVAHSDVVLRQAILETGWFKCSNCSLGSNNLFGFFYKGKYLSFDHWKESVDYYKWWQDKLYAGGDYYAFLKKVGYATSPHYINRLESLKGTY